MISILTVLIIVALSYRFPIRIGWSILIMAPVLYSMGNLILIGDAFFPLRFQQIISAVSFGLVLSAKYRFLFFRGVRKSQPVLIFLLFLVMSILYGLTELRIGFFKLALLHDFPSYIAGLIVVFCLIKTEKELQYFQVILIISAFVIAVLALVELFYSFNIAHYLCQSNASFCDIKSQHFYSTGVGSGGETVSIGIERGERYAGHAGQPNLTAILLAMFMVFIFVPLRSYTRTGYTYLLYIPLLVFCLMLLYLSQVRAAIFAFLIIFCIISLNNRKVLIVGVTILIASLLAFLFIQEFREWTLYFIQNRLSGGVFDEQRIRGLVKLSQLYVDSFPFGVGGNIGYVLDELLVSDDASAFLLYFAVSLPLGLIYLALNFMLVYDLIVRKRFVRSKNHRWMIYLSALSILLGIITQIFNENGILFYLILIYGAARASTLNIQQQKL
ncbi:hypothetical protein MNBD_GAMMA12-1642 [hydrothermal vent metagenome]|uniref:Uncharacterized protein n=1 Tax=hydrothermal vent metagenome TaxID=652676 RepID=A0A3B0Z4U1_9ZZZZ